MGGEHDGGGDPEDRNGERAISARSRKKHEQDRRERKARGAEPRRSPRDGGGALGEDDFRNIAHRRSAN
jgi:hypothetical protein